MGSGKHAMEMASEEARLRPESEEAHEDECCDLLPASVVQSIQAGEPVAIGGAFVGVSTTRQRGDTPESGPGAVRRWLDLYYRTTWLISEPDQQDARPQRSASQAIDSLFRYEHQMTSQARRQAREALWQRDRPNDPLPTAPHAEDKAPVRCHCPSCRGEWERCRCRTCRLARLLNRPTIP